MGQRAGTRHRDFGTLRENHSLSINVLIGIRVLFVEQAKKNKQTAEMKHTQKHLGAISELKCKGEFLILFVMSP